MKQKLGEFLDPKSMQGCSKAIFTRSFLSSKTYMQKFLHQEAGRLQSEVRKVHSVNKHPISASWVQIFRHLKAVDGRFYKTATLGESWYCVGSSLVRYFKMKIAGYPARFFVGREEKKLSRRFTLHELHTTWHSQTSPQRPSSSCNMRSFKSG